MTKQATDESNVARLPGLSGKTARNVTDDPYRLMRSFMLVEDCEVRASIIRLVEKVAAQYPLFTK